MAKNNIGPLGIPFFARFEFPVSGDLPPGHRKPRPGSAVSRARPATKHHPPQGTIKTPSIMFVCLPIARPLSPSVAHRNSYGVVYSGISCPPREFLGQLDTNDLSAIEMSAGFLWRYNTFFANYRGRTRNRNPGCTSSKNAPILHIMRDMLLRHVVPQWCTILCNKR